MNGRFGVCRSWRSPDCWCQSLLSIEKEVARTDPELRERSKIVLIRARDCVFSAAFYAEAIFSRGIRSNLFHKRAVYDHGAMNANESEWFEFFRYRGNGFAQKIRARFLLKQHIVAFGQNGDNIPRLEKDDSSLYLDSNPRRRSSGDFLQTDEHLHQARRLLCGYLRETGMSYEIHIKRVTVDACTVRLIMVGSNTHLIGLRHDHYDRLQ